jgi:hypothetical protein
MDAQTRVTRDPVPLELWRGVRVINPLRKMALAPDRLSLLPVSSFWGCSQSAVQIMGIAP